MIAAFTAWLHNREARRVEDRADNSAWLRRLQS